MYKHQIHIQSFGAILIVQAESGTIDYVSENIKLYLFEEKENILGQNIKKFIPNYFNLFSNDIYPVLVDYEEVTWTLPKGSVHISTRVSAKKQYYIFELEYSTMLNFKIKAFDMTSKIIKSLKNSQNLEDLYTNAVKDIQKWLQYDRVFLSKCIDDSRREIVAEARKNNEIKSFLHETFVLDDEYKNTIKTLEQNKVRLIENIHDEGVALFGIHDDFYCDISKTILVKTDKKVIDLLNYLGVISFLRINIYVAGNLWGSFTCHHSEERKYVGTEIRKMIEIIVQSFEDTLTHLENTYQKQEFAKKEITLNGIKQNLLDNFDIKQALFYDENKSLDLFNADSLAFFYEKKWEVINNNLPIEVLEQLTNELSKQVTKSILAIDNISTFFPFMTPYVAQNEGLMAIEISRTQKEYLIWFRKSITINAHLIEEDKENKDFIWTEKISSKSILWQKYELEVAKELYDEIIRILYISSQKIKKMNDNLADLFKKFREADQKLKWMYDSSIHPNFLLNEEGKAIGFNKSTAVLFEKLFHKKLENNYKLTDYIKESQKKIFQYSFEQTKKGQTHQFIYHFPNKHQIEYIWKVILFPVYDNYEAFYAVNVSLLDITESEKKNQKIAELAMVTEKTSNLAVITDANKKIIWVNDAFLKLTEYSLEEVLGKNPNFLQGEQTSQEMIAYIRENLNQKRTAQGEILNYSKSGKPYWVRLNIEPIFDADNNLTRFISLQDDITILKEKQRELEDAKRKAEEMNRLKTSFLANMSHEIRTPLNGILGLAQVMRNEEDIEEVKSLLNMQIQSGWRLLKTIEDILALSRLEAEGTANSLQKISITNLLDQLLPPLQITAHNKNLKMEYKAIADALFCWADESMLTQIFHNIIGNAIKFTEKGTIIVRTNIVDNKIVIDVEDTGIGISEKYLNKIYDPFEQESSGHKRTHEGTGIGLSICKKYIKLLEGDIKVKSIKGEGSTFSIILPIKKT
ncbi:MAG: PAS domain-containing protein [Bacteroidetes bacterium]|nr:MAG: PAS domain-containing protein [Bacteroidota bacterium]TAG87172.1 MAG: PAS domain-containing protein [Bacteroidota bacterium]